MKRHIFSPLLLLCVAATYAAQSPAAADTPAGVSVIKFNWRNTTYRPGWDNPTLSADSQSLEDLRTLASQDLGVSRVATPNGNSPARPRDRATDKGSTKVNVSEINAPPPSGPKGRREEYAYQLQLRNEGEGTIEAVDWEYVFLDASTGGELASHRFQTIHRARPGKSLTLVGTSAAPPTRIISAAALGGKHKFFEERIVVRCVVYSDRTVRWRAGATESDCADIKASMSQARRQ
ncbi:MAG: hypothetical protein QOC61_1649 [Acidobacteriota bacterium]|jgi:hypothetical protein|nr:hypothetical protein [Acidobacteriota bacterium]